jgi:hypothetical protein
MRDIGRLVFIVGIVMAIANRRGFSRKSRSYPSPIRVHPRFLSPSDL